MPLRLNVLECQHKPKVRALKLMFLAERSDAPGQYAKGRRPAQNSDTIFVADCGYLRFEHVGSKRQAARRHGWRIRIGQTQAALVDFRDRREMRYCLFAIDRLPNAGFWESHALARRGRTTIAALRLNWGGLGDGFRIKSRR
jgi:hypothetical protein